MVTDASEGAARVPRLIGRDGEMSRLLELLARAAKGRPATVLVRGEAGVGKSRLLHEFADRVRRSGAQVMRGSCIAVGSGELPYAPLIDALRRLLRSVGLDRVRELAGTAYPDLARLIVGLPEDGSEPRDPRADGQGSAQLRLFGAVLHLLDQLGRDQPVVMVLEDLHWADQSTLDLLAYLSRARSDERMLVIGSQRTTELPARHPLRELVSELERARAIELMDVVRFESDELREYLREAMNGEVTHDQVERALELTDGNALFLEEVVAAGLLTATEDDGPISVPATVEDLLLPRFELLGDDAREVMGVAATAGRRASHQLLAAACELPEIRTRAALRECVAKGMLVTDLASGTYLFRHALMREVVHQRLIPGDRLALHRAIASALTADNGLSYAEQLTVAAELSYHWFEARAFSEALGAAVQAGNQAMQLLAFREASKQFDRALRVWPEVPGAAAIAGIARHRLLSAAADAARWSGRLARAVELARAATLDVDRTQDPALAGELYERLGSYLWEAGDYVAAEGAYAEAITLLAGTPPSAVAARLLAVNATVHIRHGRAADGLALGRAALAMARQVAARAEEGRALSSVGMALTMLNQVDEGVAALDEAVGIADAEGQFEDLYRAFGTLVFSLENAGLLERAVAVAFMGLDRIRDAGLEHTRGRALLVNNACAALVQLGRWDEATSMLDRIVLDQPQAGLFPRLTLAEIKVGQGRFADAERLLAQVHDAGGAVVQPQFVGSRYACAAEMALWQRQTDAVREAVMEGLHALGEVDSPLVPLRLCALGLRSEADELLRLAALPRTARTDLRERSSTLEEIAARVGTLASTVEITETTEAAVLVDLCRAERARAEGSDNPADWNRIAERWRMLKRSYAMAYALWRAAESAARQAKSARSVGQNAGQAWRKRAGVVVREAHDIGRQVGAIPLCGAVEEWARDARFNLTDVGPPRTAPAARSSPDSVGLTKRELEVLALVTAGWTNRKIAVKLYITEKTAGVHVSNILRKLGVAKRGEAADRAKHLGLGA